MNRPKLNRYQSLVGTIHLRDLCHIHYLQSAIANMTCVPPPRGADRTVDTVNSTQIITISIKPEGPKWLILQMTSPLVHPMHGCHCYQFFILEKHRCIGTFLYTECLYCNQKHKPRTLNGDFLTFHQSAALDVH